jgi:hypothetical protein
MDNNKPAYLSDIFLRFDIFNLLIAPHLCQNDVDACMCAFKLCSPPSSERSLRLRGMLRKAQESENSPVLCTLLTLPELRQSAELNDFFRNMSVLCSPEDRTLWTFAREAYIRNVDPNFRIEGVSHMDDFASRAICGNDKERCLRYMREMYLAGNVVVGTSMNVLWRALDCVGRSDGGDARERSFRLVLENDTRLHDDDLVSRMDERYFVTSHFHRDYPAGSTLLHVACSGAGSEGSYEFAIRPLLQSAVGRRCVHMSDSTGKLPHQLLGHEAEEAATVFRVI